MVSLLKENTQAQSLFRPTYGSSPSFVLYVFVVRVYDDPHYYFPPASQFFMGPFCFFFFHLSPLFFYLHGSVTGLSLHGLHLPSTRLHTLAVDAWGSLAGGTLLAGVVDVDDVEGVNVAGDVPKRVREVSNFILFFSLFFFFFI